MKCGFANCDETAVRLMTFKSECGHELNANVPACEAHTHLPDKSPNRHTCRTCGRRVHMEVQR